MATTNNRFKIDLADGWQDLTVHYFMGPETHGVQHALSLQVDPETDPDDVSEYAQERVAQVLESIPGAEVLKQEEKTMAGGMPAYEVIYKWAPSEDKVVFQKMVFVKHGKVMYNFNGTFTKQTLKTLGVEADRMIESLVPGGV